MQELPELLKIIEAGLKGNGNMVRKYGELVAERLESQGETRSADLVRKRLLKAPSQTALPQFAGGGGPKDQESRLDLIDHYSPSPAQPLVVSPRVEEAINQYIEQIKHSSKLLEVGIPPETRLLLFGPPGCGKNRIAEHIANELGLELLIARCDSMISSYLGSTSKNVRAIFNYASTHPCVLLLDELDALGKARSDKQEIGELQRIVIALLQNLDTADNSLIVIGATNHPDLLDTALWRRFPTKLKIDKPGKIERKELYKVFSRGFGAKIDWEKLAKISEGLSADDIRLVTEDSIRQAILRDKDQMTFASLVRRTVTCLLTQGGKTTPSPEEIIEWLTAHAGADFSQRKLAEISGTSTRRVASVINRA